MDTLYVVLAIVAVVVIVIMKTATVVPQQSAYVVENLGRYSRTIQAGFHILVPFIERIAYKHNLKEEALDIPEILRRSGRDRISILKMDIEGSECVVFAAPNVSTWLSRVDCLAVELHDDTHFGRCTDIFSRAIIDQGFSLSRSRELTVARRRSR